MQIFAVIMPIFRRIPQNAQPITSVISMQKQPGPVPIVGTDPGFEASSLQ